MAVARTRNARIRIKVSRSDFLSELKKPQKAEVISRYCDRWWIVAADRKVAQVDELPKTWGLLVAQKNGLRQLKPAPQLERAGISQDQQSQTLTIADIVELDQDGTD